MEQRRRAQRFNVEVPAMFRGNGFTLPGVTANVSAVGALIENVPSVPEVGVSGSLRLIASQPIAGRHPGFPTLHPSRRSKLWLLVGACGCTSVPPCGPCTPTPPRPA